MISARNTGLVFQEGTTVKRFLIGLFFAITTSLAWAEERFLTVEFLRVYDGDTVVVLLPDLPAPLDKVRIRLEGIDTPEIGKGARCAAEELRAQAAKRFLADLLGNAKELRVYNFKWDKYGGRVLGDLHVADGDVRDLMIAAGHAVRYTGVGQRRDWCAAK
jgi:endonuclease YncB( thermonuclease family)